MAKKPITKVLKALDEELGLGLFKNLGNIPRGVTITKRPKELERDIHSDVLTGTGPLRKLYHGTTDPTPYSEMKVFPDSRQGGIHLSENPDIATAHGLSEKGGRVYPVLADPGRTLDIPEGLPNWYDPEWFADAAQFAPERTAQEDIRKLSRMINEDEGVQARHLKELGYDSASYLHPNPLRWDADPSKSFLITDPSRLVPAFSATGQNIARVRGVLANSPHSNWNEWDPHNDYLFERFGVNKSKPERITAAAIRQDGKLYTGANHGEAGLNAPGYYEDGRVVEERPDDDYGFVTSTGRYVTRREALEIVNKSGQLPKGEENWKGNLTAEDVDSDWNR